MEDETTRYNVSLCTSMAPKSIHQSSHHPTSPCKRSSRRNEHLSWPHHCFRLQTNIFLLVIIFASCLSLSNAKALYIEEQMIEARELNAGEGSTLARLARSGTILVDLSPPPKPADWNLDTGNHGDLKKRSASSSSSPSSSTRTSTTATSTATGGALPTPFDVGFNNNITTSCQSFMTSMLSNSTFKSCLPFSMLLQNSNSFFQASKSITRITEALDVSCEADVNVCSDLLSSFASNITSSSACSSDLQSQNPLIQAARLGLLAYRPLYTASCLRNIQTSSYCFAEAITNATNPTDSYLYFLPLNVSLVGGSQPTCNRCLQQTMNVFEAASSDRKSALASDYVSAAMQVNVNCGPNFVNTSLATAISSGSSSLHAASLGNTALVALVLVVGSWLL